MSSAHPVQPPPQVVTIDGDDCAGGGTMFHGTATVGHPIPTSIMKKTLYVDNTSTTQSSIPPEEPVRRMVAVRYFLDRPGYGLHNATVRLWMDPPAMCAPSDLHHYFVKHGIIPSEDASAPHNFGDTSSHLFGGQSDGGLESLRQDDFLVEVYLDKFQSFMLLQACEDADIEWNLTNSTIQQPGTFNVRLTDIAFHHQHQVAEPKAASSPALVMANTAPVGLFSFSLMVGLETLAKMESLIPDPDENGSFFGIDPSFVVSWGPYMIFSGGGLMWITGILQVFRNNIYGAVAFLVFGSFWFANGTKVILETHFSEPGTVAYELRNNSADYHDPWGTLVRLAYIMSFVLALLYNTFAGSKVSTVLMSLLTCKFICQMGASWSDAAGWMQVFFGWLVSWLAFYVFLVELTNNVYHREVLQLHKWSEEHSPGEIFAAPGNGGHTLYSKAQRKVKRSFSSVTKVRMALHHSTSSVLHHGKKTA
jgi:succinate-acetate transporter protein